MELKTLTHLLPLIEYQLYITDVSTQESKVELRSVLDLTFKPSVSLETLENINTSVFAVITHKETYVFSDYELSEYYIDEGNNCVKATFVK